MRALILAALFSTTTVHASALEPSPPITGKADLRFAPIDRLFTRFLKEHELPGAAVAVSRHGRLVYARGFGYADTEARLPVKPDSLFRIASVSKPFTAAAVLQLIDHGKLKLTDHVFHVLGLEEPKGPDVAFDPRWKKVTIGQLLHHTGGWDRDKAFDPMFATRDIVKELKVPPPASPEAVIRYMLRRPLQFDPGTKYAYSNFGYCLLGRVIEKVSGEAYGKYVRQDVLTPLGIHRMKLGHTLLSARAEDEVRYYAPGKGSAVMGPELGKPVPRSYGGWCLESMDAHGGWIASAPDLVRFAAAFEEPARCKILAPAGVERLFARPAGPVDLRPNGTPKSRYYACGWEVVGVGDGRFNYFHSGLLSGTSTLLVHRSDGFAWAILFNGTREKKTPSGLIDPLMHGAVDEVKEWP